LIVITLAHRGKLCSAYYNRLPGETMFFVISDIQQAKQIS